MALLHPKERLTRPWWQVSPKVLALLKKVGTTLAEAKEASKLDWSGKGLRAEDGPAVAELLPLCPGLREVKFVCHAIQTLVGALFSAHRAGWEERIKPSMREENGCWLACRE